LIIYLVVCISFWVCISLKVPRFECISFNMSRFSMYVAEYIFFCTLILLSVCRFEYVFHSIYIWFCISLNISFLSMYFVEYIYLWIYILLRNYFVKYIFLVCILVIVSRFNYVFRCIRLSFNMNFVENILFYFEFR
jgi:hypothetical protein